MQVRLRSAFRVPALNRVHLCGVVHGVHTGLHSGTPAVEFTLTTCTFPPTGQSGPSTSAPSLRASPRDTTLATPAPPPMALARSAVAVGIERQQYVVRCLGSTALVEAIAASVVEDAVVNITGRLKTHLSAETRAPSDKGRVSHTHSLVLVRQAELQSTEHALRIVHIPTDALALASIERVNAYLRDVLYDPATLSAPNRERGAESAAPSAAQPLA